MPLFATIVLAAVFVGSVLFVFLLRRFRRRAAKRAVLPRTDFAINELNALMLQGKVTRKEFERARRASIRSRRVTNPTGPAPRRQGFEVLEPRDHF